jgi:hypothetical protein
MVNITMNVVDRGALGIEVARVDIDQFPELA